MKKLLISGLLSCSLLLSGLAVSGQKAEAASIGEQVTDIAVKYIGVPYRWGGTSPSGFDCSGFLNYAFNQVGVSLPRTAADIYTQGQPISKSDLQEGDLVFFSTYKAGASHAGIYLENGNFVHASSSQGVTISNLSNSYWTSTYIGSKRIGNSTSGWEFTDGSWYFYKNSAKATGWINDRGTWYYLASDGKMQTGWVYTGWKWYYLHGSGAMATGWVYTDGNWYYLNKSGAMLTGWVLTGNKWYFLQKDGSMAKDTVIDGYKVGSDGAWII